jgi:hypothetical protein
MCSHPIRAQLETRILTGEPISLVAVDAGISVTAVNRHRRNHLRGELRAVLACGPAANHVADFADQLVELTEDANSVREFARASNNPDLLLRAIASTRDTLLTLTHHLGVDSEETVTSLRGARAVLLALVRVLPTHPAALAELLKHLRNNDQADLAAALETAVARMRYLPAPVAPHPERARPKGIRDDERDR